MEPEATNTSFQYIMISLKESIALLQMYIVQPLIASCQL